MLLVLMLLDASDVLGRYLLNKPVKGAWEVSQILLAGVVLFAWAHTQAKGGHVKLDLFVTRLSPRAQAMVDFVTSLLGAVLFGLVVWQAAGMAMIYWEAGYIVDVIRIPLAPFQLFVSLGALFLCLELIIEMFEHLRQWRKAG